MISRLTFEPIFGSWAVAMTAILILLAIPILVEPRGGDLTPRRRRTILAIRIVASLILAFAAIQPAWIRSAEQPTAATLAVLLDRSRSMTLSDAESRTRGETQLAVWRRLASVLEARDPSLAVQVLGYSGDTTPLELPAVEAELAGRAEGMATDLGEALAAGLRTAGGQPLAGVVMIGDGVQNVPRAARAVGEGKAVVDPQSVARTLASLDVPLWTVGVGPPGDADQVRDAEVSELPESFSVFSKNQWDVDFVVRARALAGRELTVRVWLTEETKANAQRETKDEGTTGLELATRRVTPSRASDTIAVSIPLTAPDPGNYRLLVTVDPQPGEAIVTNNSQVAFVDVREGGGRILYLEGQVRPEQTFIKRSLGRLPDLEMVYRWIATDTASQWPVGLQDALEQPAADVIILGDLPSAAVGDTQLQAIAQRVSDGAGLLVLGGLNALGSGGYQSTPLAEVLPVRLRAAGRNPSPQADSREFPLRLPKLHPITALSPDARTLNQQQAAWETLPPLLGINDLGEPRAAPGVQVLLETMDSDPVLVTGEYGRGRVAVFAGDSTWRWWRSGNSLAHRRFWRQMILWLLDRDADSADVWKIELDRRRAEVDEPIGYRVSSMSVRDEPRFEVVSEDGTTREVSPEVMQPGDAETGDPFVWEGTLPSMPPGVYRFRASEPDNRSPPDQAAEGSAEKSFQILDNDAELSQPFADFAYLTQLAAQTSAAGGASYAAAEIDELLDRLARLRQGATSLYVTKHRLGDSPFSAWPMLIALVGLLGAEWYLRRRWGLV